MYQQKREAQNTQSHRLSPDRNQPTVSKLDAVTMATAAPCGAPLCLAGTTVAAVTSYLIPL